jgi:hypothetical protein
MADTPHPNIRKACLEISYDNGGVNRHRPETQVRKELDDFLAKRPYSDNFSEIDKWLGNLSKDELQTVCAGEESEMNAILSSSPAFTATLLEEYFDEVC